MAYYGRVFEYENQAIYFASERLHDGRILVHDRYAQDAAPQACSGVGLEDIVVTVRRRDAGRFRHLVGYTNNVAPSGLLDPIYGLPIPDPKYRRDPRQREFSGRLRLKWEPLPDFSATAHDGHHLLRI